MPKERLPHISMMLRQVFQLPEFKTKAARLGKVARVVESQVMYYGADRRMKRVVLP